MSNSSLKPIKLWGKGGANPPKVAIVLKELAIPYEVIEVPFSDVKKPEYTAINPNGRLPAIYDPNTDLTLWESGAIVEYLVEKYDKDHKLSFPAGSNEAYLMKQYLYFQASGQGPYYGQAIWFKHLHAEKLPSALARYIAEIDRVSGVLDNVLAAQEKVAPGGDGPWLVGGRCSLADLSFITWQNMPGKHLGEDFKPEKYAHVQAWVENMMKRKAVKEALDEIETK